MATKLWILRVLVIEPIHLSSIFSMVGNIHLKLHVFANDPTILRHCYTREKKKKKEANSSQQGEGASKSQQTYDARYPTIWPMVDGPGNRFLESLFAWLISYNVRRTRDGDFFSVKALHHSHKPGYTRLSKQLLNEPLLITHVRTRVPIFWRAMFNSFKQLHSHINCIK